MGVETVRGRAATQIHLRLDHLQVERLGTTAGARFPLVIPPELHFLFMKTAMRALDGQVAAACAERCPSARVSRATLDLSRPDVEYGGPLPLAVSPTR